MIMKRYLILAFVALQVLDIITTQHFLSTGRGVEGNPVVILLMAHLGTWWWVGKLAMVLPTVPVLVRGRTRYAAIMTGLYAAVIVNNLTI